MQHPPQRPTAVPDSGNLIWIVVTATMAAVAVIFTLMILRGTESSTRRIRSEQQTTLKTLRRIEAQTSQMLRLQQAMAERMGVTLDPAPTTAPAPSTQPGEDPKP